ncbi:MAG: hypothetical protein GY757_01715, partial [bacterium]|nr:hypothetical protein [bacterium]
MDDKTIVTPSGSIDISEDTNVVHPYELVTVPKKIHSMEDTNLKPDETIMSPNPGFTEEVDTAEIASSNQTDTGDIDSFSRTDSGDISGLLQTDATKVSPTGKDNDMPELDSADEDITAKGISYDSMSGEGKKFSGEKTSVLFNIKDITSKVNAEIDDIPDDYNDELDIAHMSRIIKAKIPDRSEADKLKINRNFLLDAEPFNIEKLVEDIKKTSEGLISGFKCLDRSITIPPDSLTVVAGLPKHGKSCFMMNMMLNMCHEYKGKHFIYYTYEEPKWEVQTKMINMSGIKPFSKGLNSNIDRWKYEFKNTDINTLKLKGDREKEFRG